MSLHSKSFPSVSITKLDVNCKIFKICVVESPNDNIEISWSNTTMRSLDLKTSGDTVTILDHAAVGIYGTLALINLKKDAQLLIKLPASYNGKLILQTKEETIHMSGITAPATIGISTNTGEILLENVCFQTLDIRGNAGKINCYSLDTTGSINISSKSGAINCGLMGTNSDYTISCTTKNPKCCPPETNGSGTKKVLLSSERGEIHYTFQNGVETQKPSCRYDRRNSFKEW